MIRLTVNGEPRELEAPVALTQFLERHNIHRRQIAVEHNGTILHRRELEGIMLQDGDVLEIVHMVGGG
jgi:thiamine biosynthesis protein ThiS